MLKTDHITRQNETDRNIVDLDVEGMMCASCVSRVESGLRKLPGVSDVSVNLTTGQARVEHDGSIESDRLIERVEESGYDARVHLHESRNSGEEEEMQARRRAAISLPLAAIVLVLAMGPMVSDVVAEFVGSVRPVTDLAQFVFTTIILFGPGFQFFRLAFRIARHGSADMNSLVALGTGAAWAFSSYNLVQAWIQPSYSWPELYFESAAVVAALVLLGRYLEASAKSKTRNALRQLAQLIPDTAHKLDPDSGSMHDVPTSSVLVGDRLLVKGGERIPVDGAVVDRTATVDESAMTGESIPRDREPGEEVAGGTVNAGSAFSMEARQVGSGTRLSRIVEIVEEAQSSKANIQRLADRVAGVFVPIVLLIAVATFLVWVFAVDADVADAVLPTVAVLVVACPCALGLAVPTGLVAASGHGARNGLLIRNVQALEMGTQIDTVVFDKTGTLTTGELRVERVTTLNSVGEKDLLSYAASVEAYSEHPIGEAIVAAARERGCAVRPVEEFEATAGVGVRGTVDGTSIVVGAPGRIDSEGAQRADAGDSIAIQVDGMLAGSLQISDSLRDDAAETVGKLREMGVQTVMLTGDTEDRALEMAAQAGIDTVKAGLLPEQKVDAIEELRKSSGRVAMVGDGINDAPALAKADLGIALSSGTEIASRTADITVLGGSLMKVVDAINLAHRTKRIIRQNLFWAFIYNIVGIPLAAFGLLNPMIAGAAMAFSSVSVVTNSLRLR